MPSHRGLPLGRAAGRPLSSRNQPRVNHVGPGEQLPLGSEGKNDREQAEPGSRPWLPTEKYRCQLHWERWDAMGPGRDLGIMFSIIYFMAAQGWRYVAGARTPWVRPSATIRTLRIE